MYFFLVLEKYFSCVNNSRWTTIFPEHIEGISLYSVDNLAVSLNCTFVGFVLLSGICEHYRPRSTLYSDFQLVYWGPHQHCRSRFQTKGRSVDFRLTGKMFLSFPPSSFKWSQQLGGLFFSFPRVLASCKWSQIGNSGPQGSGPGCPVAPRDLMASVLTFLLVLVLLPSSSPHRLPVMKLIYEVRKENGIYEEYPKEITHKIIGKFKKLLAYNNAK